MKRYEVVVDIVYPPSYEQVEVVQPFRWRWLARVFAFAYVAMPTVTSLGGIVLDAFVREARR